MSFSECGRTDGLGLAELVASKAITPGEILEEAIARAEQLNPLLNAVVFKDYERAWEMTKGTLPKGPFTGVPFLLKDIFLNVSGTPTRQGSKFFPAFPAPHDSYLMARFRKAGLVPFGKTNVPEFGLVPTTEGKLYGPAHNPWNLAVSTGGSSGGLQPQPWPGYCPFGTRQRWRRIDPYSGVMLWSGWTEAVARTRLRRTGRRRRHGRAVRGTCRLAQRTRHSRVARHRRGL